MKSRKVIVTALSLLFAAFVIFIAAVAFLPISEPPTAVPGQALTITAFADQDYWWTDRSLLWVSDLSDRQVRIPRGSVTDLASIRPPFRSLFSRVGRHRTAAAIHDCLYWTRQYPERKEADQVFLEAMNEFEVPAWRQKTIYFSVRMFGRRAWKAAGRASEEGELRVIPGERIPPPSDVGWIEYRDQIRSEEGPSS